MALNDIKVPKENAQGTFDEIALAPADIGAQTLFTTETLTVNGAVTLTAARAKNYSVLVAGNSTITLPTTGHLVGDIVVIRYTAGSGTLSVQGFGSGMAVTSGQQFRYIATGTGANQWATVAVDTHTHTGSQVNVGTTANLPLKTGTNGVIEAGSFGTAAGSFCEGNDARLSDDRDPNLHAASHLPDGADEIFDQDLNTDSSVTFGGVTAESLDFTGTDGIGFAESAGRENTRANLGLGSAAVQDDTAFAASGSITTSGLTQATARILGRTSSSTGAVEEITVGSGLSLSAGELSSTVSAGVGGGTGSTDNAILRADGTGGSTLQNSALNIDDATTSTQANVAITNQHSETNSALVLTPKGNGALIAGPKPDGAATGGNARGNFATDLQRDRSSNLRIASGNYSVICGGNGNRATNTYAICVGGETSTASGVGSFIGSGSSNTASGANTAIPSGAGNTASNTRAAICGGNSNTASGLDSFVGGGEVNEATASYSFVGGGTRASSNRYGLFAHAAGQFAAGGDAQRIRAVLRCKTTTNAAVEMALDGSTTYLTIPSGKVIFCNIKVVGVKSDGSAVATYERQYAVKNVAGTSTEIYAPVTIGADNAAGTTLAVSCDDTGDFISIQPTGIASETWRWVASVDAVEVAYGT